MIYKISAGGTQTVLHSFNAATDGGYPGSGVTPDAAGNLYGAAGDFGPGQGGTVYKLDPAGNYTVLYSFPSCGPAGCGAGGHVALDSAGNLYGTTFDGGPSGFSGYGVVFKLDPSGQETVLYSFTGGKDGGQPEAGVIRDSRGNLYGTCTFYGKDGGGVLYKLIPP